MGKQTDRSQEFWIQSNPFYANSSNFFFLLQTLLFLDEISFDNLFYSTKFIPQELGDSRSAYSLRNQLKPNPDFNDVQLNGKIVKNVAFDGIEKMIKKMRTEWGVRNLHITFFYRKKND